MQYANTTALVTGASGGLGQAFAEQLATRGCDLIIVARRRDALMSVANGITERTGRTVTVLPADLSEPHVGEKLLDGVAQLGLRVDTVINNAGFGLTKPFAESETAEIYRQLHVNVNAVVEISRAFLPQLLESGRGALVNVASLTGYAPTPGMAVYAASKAFVMRFTEALAYEQRGSKLTVLAYSPGPTRTGFYQNSGASDRGVTFESPHSVVSYCLSTLDRRDVPVSAVSGLRNRVSSRVLTLVPRRTALRLMDSTPSAPPPRLSDERDPPLG